jgi:hypothetical protein
MNLLERIFKRPERLDHGPMYICVIVALFLWSLSLLIAGPVRYSIIDELNDTAQNWLGGGIFIGSSMCLTGIVLGTRFVRPHIDIRTCYAWGAAGTPAISIAVWVYFWAAVAGSLSPVLSGMSSAFSLLVPVGVVWNAINFWIERRRIERNIPRALDEWEQE